MQANINHQNSLANKGKKGPETFEAELFAATTILNYMREVGFVFFLYLSVILSRLF
jgi:hypothetical protein